jgi:hypothetical protein
VVHFCINSPIWVTGSEICIVPALCRQIVPLSRPHDHEILSLPSLKTVTKFWSSDISSSRRVLGAGRDDADRLFFSSSRTWLLYCFCTRLFEQLTPFLVRQKRIVCLTILLFLTLLSDNLRPTACIIIFNLDSHGLLGYFINSPYYRQSQVQT